MTRFKRLLPAALFLVVAAAAFVGSGGGTPPARETARLDEVLAGGPSKRKVWRLFASAAAFPTARPDGLHVPIVDPRAPGSGAATIDLVWDGPRPGTQLRPGTDVIATGRLTGPGRFEADELIAKQAGGPPGRDPYDRDGVVTAAETSVGSERGEVRGYLVDYVRREAGVTSIVELIAMKDGRRLRWASRRPAAAFGHSPGSRPGEEGRAEQAERETLLAQVLRDEVGWTDADTMVFGWVVGMTDGHDVLVRDDGRAQEVTLTALPVWRHPAAR